VDVKIKPFIGILFFSGVVFCFHGATGVLKAQDAEAPSVSLSMSPAIATMCEGISESMPVNPTIVFPVGNKNAFCLSSFDAVKEKTHINHFWYRRDKLVSNVRLLIQPPRWTTYSSIDLRESDKGPWRVDVVDANNNLLKTLRFSITD
jgi:hypothetical protein